MTAAHYEPATALEVWPAAGGKLLIIRPVAPDDGPLIGALMRALSPAARHRRFHGGVTELSAPLLQRFTHTDYRVEMALLATIFNAGREIGVGEARYAEVEGAPDTREFAIVVADSRQRTGIGSKLLRSLTRHAERCNVKRMFGDVLADSVSMLGLARKLGFTVRGHPEDARLVRVEKRLPTHLLSTRVPNVSTIPLELTE